MEEEEGRERREGLFSSVVAKARKRSSTARKLMVGELIQSETMGKNLRVQETGATPMREKSRCHIEALMSSGVVSRIEEAA